LNVQAFDIQHACPKTCSLEPKGQGTNIVPSIKGGFFFGPWLHTQIFINFGTGAYRFDDREPVGSTAEQQINQTRFLELGFLTNYGEHMELRGSLWGIKNDSDVAYNNEEETFVGLGPSQRYGVNLDTKIKLTNQMTMTGRFAASRSTFQQTPKAIPLTPQLAGGVVFHQNWNSNWSTTLQWQYRGKRQIRSQSFPSFHTLDVFIQYHLPMMGDDGNLRATLGMINAFNNRSPSSSFYFDSGARSDSAPAIDVNYFPGQPRTVVSGISWFF